MKASIIRFFKPYVAARTFNVAIRSVTGSAPLGTCEVTEFEKDDGWDRWIDSVIAQDFEDSFIEGAAATTPANLCADGKLASSPQGNMLELNLPAC